MFPLLIGLLACTAPGPSDSGEGTAAAPRRVDEGGVVTCADPSARAQGPMETYAWEGLVDASEANFQVQYGGGGAAVADFDDDGALDVVLPNAGPDQYWRGLAEGGWADETAARWPGGETDASVGAVPVDVDADGDLDVYVTNMRGPNRLLWNDGTGHFTDGTAAAGVAGGDHDSIAASFADIDADGDLDLFVANHRDDETLPEGMYAGEMYPGHPSALYLNDGDGTFTDVSDRLPAALQDNGYPFVGTFHDFDGDDLPDLYIAMDFGPMSSPNLLLHNDGGTFSVVTGTGLEHEGYAMGVGLGDIDGNGEMDLAISDWNRMSLLMGAGDGTWYDAALAKGLMPVAEGRAESWGLELADMDNDGDLDLPVAFGPLLMPPEIEEIYADTWALMNPDQQPDALFVLGDDGAFRDEGVAWGLAQTGNSRGFAVADLDGDGWLDLLKRYVDGVASMHLSRCGEDAWLRVELWQDGPNPRAVGATVTVEAGGGAWTRRLHAGGTGFAAGHPPEVHVGLGDLDAIDRVRVRWPDGGETVTEALATRQSVRIWR
ncbi:MAG: CRTAC1 family protein [Myxococcota bacterium]